jgi:hypothetical protein
MHQNRAKEVRSMTPALAGSRGIIGPLQKVLKPNSKRIHLTSDAHDFLDDFGFLAQNLHDRPTRLFELEPSTPQELGTTDASAIGLGGIFLSPLNNKLRPNRHIDLMCGATAFLRT